MSRTRRKPGRLGPQVECYRARLVVQGYTPSTIRNMLKELGQVGRWLTVEELDGELLHEQRITAFITGRHAAGYRRAPGPRAMAPLLSYLREADVIAAVSPAMSMGPV